MSAGRRGKTATAIRHVAFEDLGAFEPVLSAAGYVVSYHEAGAGPPLPDSDLLVVLGGPLGAYEADRYPFLADEIEILQRRLAAGLPTIGICLGAQLMAHVLGAKVYPGTKEIGFAPVSLTEAGREMLAELADVPVLHWHGDTFDLPEGADLLASTPACRHQAFALGPHAVGFQFHPEAGGETFERWLIGHAVELAQAGLDPRDLRAANARHGAALQAAGAAWLRRWLAALSAPGS